MKLTKNEFKAMIKDCIKELLKEGAFDKALTEAALAGAPVRQQSKPQVGRQPAARNPIDAQRARDIARKIAGADDFRYGPGFSSMGGDEEFPEDLSSIRLTQQAPGLQHLVETAAQNVARGDQSLANQYASIFADTAMNTIPKQMANDRDRSGYSGLAGVGMPQQMEKVSAEELQSLAPMGDMSHWAQLAFGTAGKK